MTAKMKLFNLFIVQPKIGSKLCIVKKLKIYNFQVSLNRRGNTFYCYLQTVCKIRKSNCRHKNVDITNCPILTEPNLILHIRLTLVVGT
jgi:hypothetical protein